MAVDFSSELDDVFMEDALRLNGALCDVSEGVVDISRLRNDDIPSWAVEDSEMPDDLSQFLDVESNLTSDLIQQLPDDLGLSSVSGMGKVGHEAVWRDGSDTSDSGIDCFSVKQEPMSPSSQCSETSIDSGHSTLSLQSQPLIEGLGEFGIQIGDVSEFTLPDLTMPQYDNSVLNLDMTSGLDLTCRPQDMTSGLDLTCQSQDMTSELDLKCQPQDLTCELREEVVQEQIFKQDLPTPPQTPPRDGAALISPFQPSALLSPTGQTIALTTEGSTIQPATAINSLQFVPSSPSSAAITQQVVSIKSEIGNAVDNLVASTLLPGGVTIKTEPASVNQVLNAKVKIQPKPQLPQRSLSQSSPSKRQALSSGGSKPLVLTAEEFARLTARGVLKLHPSSSKASTASAASPTTATITSRALTSSRPLSVSGHTAVMTSRPVTRITGTISKPTSVTRVLPPTPGARGATMELTGSLPHISGDDKVIRRQQRMIKNRESACLSRKRKKEYVQTLEQQLHESCADNDKLLEENMQLKLRNAQLQQENNDLRMRLPGVTLSIKPLSTGAKRSGVVLLAIIFLLGLNLGPISNLLHDQRADVNITSPGISGVHHRSRQLLQYPQEEETRKVPDNTRRSLISPHPIKKTRSVVPQTNMPQSDSHDLMLIRDYETPTSSSVCPTNFNTTESQRIMRELTGFMRGHTEERAKHYNHNRAEEKARTAKESRKLKNKKPKRYQTPHKLKAALRSQQTIKTVSDGANYELQVFNGADRNYQKLLNTLQRRNDTFYIVSFRRDHLLLPATSYNKTSRPRMSLVMPAVGLNETLEPGDGSMAMLQIECEVTSTRFVHVHKSAVPDHLQENSTFHHGGSDSGQKERREAWQAPEGWL